MPRKAHTDFSRPDPPDRPTASPGKFLQAVTTASFARCAANVVCRTMMARLDDIDPRVIGRNVAVPTESRGRMHRLIADPPRHWRASSAPDSPSVSGGRRGSRQPRPATRPRRGARVPPRCRARAVAREQFAHAERARRKERAPGFGVSFVHASVWRLAGHQVTRHRALETAADGPIAVEIDCRLRQVPHTQSSVSSLSSAAVPTCASDRARAARYRSRRVPARVPRSHRQMGQRLRRSFAARAVCAHVQAARLAPTHAPRQRPR